MIFKLVLANVLKIIYKFLIFFSDDFDPWRDPAIKHGKCSVVIALMQQYRRTRQNIKPAREKIGFTVYKVIIQSEKDAAYVIFENDLHYLALHYYSTFRIDLTSKCMLVFGLCIFLLVCIFSYNLKILHVLELCLSEH